MPRPKGNKDRPTPKSDSDLFRERLYGELTTPEAAEEERRKEEEKKKKGGFFGHKNFYFWLYSFTEKHFSKKKKKEYTIPEIEGKKKKDKELSPEYREAFDFLGWKLDKDVVMNVQMSAAVIGLIMGLAIAGAVFLGFTLMDTVSTGTCGDGICYDMPWQDPAEDETSCPQDCTGDMVRRQSSMEAAGPPILMYAVIGFIPIIVLAVMVFYVQRYPLNKAEAEKMKALTYVPEIMNYLIMKMRLQPNLETAVEFAAEHGEGRIADEFKELLWKNRVGIYDNIEEGLDEMAYKWEPYSEEFKHAITLIRASVLIPNDVERNALYDKTLDELLSSTKEKMEKYARSMKQPSMYLFYVSILLPLMILIMLPVAAAFAKAPIATVEILVVLYVIVFPLVTLVYAKTILSKRPGGYVPPNIPDDHPKLPKKGTARIGGMTLPIVPVAIMLFFAIFLTGYFIEDASQISEEDLAIHLERYGEELDQPSYIQYYLPMSIAVALGFYFYGRSVDKKKIQDKVIKMEFEFKDAMYLMASRLGEKKPLEDCLGYVKKFMPESPVATELFGNIQRNIMVLGLTLRSAIFDNVYGAMKHIHSRLMDTSFRIMVDSIDLGPEVASYSLLGVSEQIRNTQKINDLMRKLLDEVTGMMSSMATFIGPVVLGMIASLQEVIVGVVPGADVGETASEGANEALAQGSSAVGGGFLGGGESAVPIDQLMASSMEFQFIIAMYILLLAVILSYFTGKVKYGDDRNSIFFTIGKTIPFAMLVFVGSLYAGQMLMGGL
jgi:hypothetical protein